MSNATNRLVFYNSDGYPHNFRLNDGIWNGKIFFDPNSSGLFKTESMYILEEVPPIEYDGIMSVINTEIYSDLGMSIFPYTTKDIEVNDIKSVNQSPLFYSKWIYGNKLHKLFPIGTMISFTGNVSNVSYGEGDFISTNYFNVLQTKKDAIMIATNTANNTFYFVYDKNVHDLKITSHNTVSIPDFTRNLQSTFNPDIDMKLSIIGSKENDYVLEIKDKVTTKTRLFDYDLYNLVNGNVFKLNIELLTERPLLYSGEITLINDSSVLKMEFLNGRNSNLEIGSVFMVENLNGQHLLNSNEYTIKSIIKETFLSTETISFSSRSYIEDDGNYLTEYFVEYPNTMNIKIGDKIKFIKNGSKNTNLTKRIITITNNEYTNTAKLDSVIYDETLVSYDIYKVLKDYQQNTVIVTSSIGFETFPNLEPVRCMAISNILSYSQTVSTTGIQDSIDIFVSNHSAYLSTVGLDLYRMGNILYLEGMYSGSKPYFNCKCYVNNVLLPIKHQYTDLNGNTNVYNILFKEGLITKERHNMTEDLARSYSADIVFDIADDVQDYGFQIQLNNAQYYIEYNDNEGLTTNTLETIKSFVDKYEIVFNKNGFDLLYNTTFDVNTIDTTFNTGLGFNNTVNSIIQDTNGKYVVGGTYLQYKGLNQNRIIRLNQDSSLDSTFNVGTAFDNQVRSIIMDSNDKYVIVGDFITYKGLSQKYICRLNQDGSLDSTFNIGVGFNNIAYSIIQDSNGKYVIGGSFTTYNSIPSNRLIRLNQDGSIDSTFNVGTGFDFSYIYSIIQDSNGKYVMGGSFTTYNGTTQNYICRINQDGSLDTSFVIGTGFNNYVRTIIQDSNGKYVIGGNFTQYKGLTQNRIIRLNQDGSLDTTFVIGTGFNSLINSILQDSNGKYIVGGNFTQYKGLTQNRTIRLNQDGSKDTTFVIGTGFNTDVNTIIKNSKGQFVIGGTFITYNSLTQNRICILNNDGMTYNHLYINGQEPNVDVYEMKVKVNQNSSYTLNEITNNRMMLVSNYLDAGSFNVIDYGYTTSMIINVNGSDYPSNNKEFNIIGVHDNIIELSYQGAMYTDINKTMNIISKNYLRKPRESNEHDVYYNFRWEDDRENSIFLYDISGNNLKPWGNNPDYAYTGVKPLNINSDLVILNSEPNKNKDYVKIPSKQQTIFDELSFILDRFDDDSLDILPEPIQLFIGYNSTDEGVHNKNLIMERVDNVSYTGYSDGISLYFTFIDNAMTINSSNNEDLLELGFKTNRKLRIKLTDNNIYSTLLFENYQDFTIKEVTKKKIIINETFVNFSTQNNEFDFEFILLPEQIGYFLFLGENEIKDERLESLTKLLGINLTEEDEYIFEESDIKEESTDYILLNRKRKEILTNYNDIYDYIGSYRAIFNAINFFGYEDIQLVEYYKNIDTKSPLYNKLKQVVIPDLMDRSVDGWTYSEDLIGRVGYQKTNLFNLTYNITDEEGNNLNLYTLAEVQYKLNGLKKWLRNNILPINTNIKDITGVSQCTNTNWTRFDPSVNIIDQKTIEQATVVNFNYMATRNFNSSWIISVRFYTVNGFIPDAFDVKIQTYTKESDGILRPQQEYNIMKTDLKPFNFTVNWEDDLYDLYFSIETIYYTTSGLGKNATKMYKLEDMDTYYYEEWKNYNLVENNFTYKKQSYVQTIDNIYIFDQCGNYYTIDKNKKFVK